MDRAALQTHLARTENNIIEGEQRIARQRAVILELESESRDTTGDTLLLELFQDLQSAYVTVRDRLRAEIDKNEG
jgi:hypothetical protein